MDIIEFRDVHQQVKSREYIVSYFDNTDKKPIKLNISMYL